LLYILIFFWGVTHFGNFVIFRQQALFLVLKIFFLGMQAACRNNPDDPEALKALDVLFETAMISSGLSVGTVSC
jgi:hypothetical protein